MLRWGALALTAVLSTEPDAAVELNERGLRALFASRGALRALRRKKVRQEVSMCLQLLGSTPGAAQV